MTVVFGVPSAEHVTITAGVPLSRTGRISGGSRVIGFSSIHRWDQAGSGTWSRRLQKYLEHLEVDSQRWRRHKSLQDIFGSVRVHRPEALDETLAGALGILEIGILYFTVAYVAAFELIRLV